MNDDDLIIEAIIKSLKDYALGDVEYNVNKKPNRQWNNTDHRNDHPNVQGIQRRLQQILVFERHLPGLF